MFEALIYILAAIGLYALSFYLYDNLKTPAVLFLSSVKQLLGLESTSRLKAKYGDWVAITGATDGIGKAFARELARRSMNIVLISRNPEKLKKVADEIEMDFSVKTGIIAADFSSGKEVIKKVEQELSKLPVKILINNVGQSTPEPGPMAKFTDEELWSVINTNIGPATQLCRFFIKRLCDTKQAGLVLNVSSGTEIFPVPYGAIYAATKAYLRSLTLALRDEARPYGIEVGLLSPHFVVTKINNYSKFVMSGNLFIPDVDTYAKSAVNRLGKLDMTTGYFWHDLEYAFVSALPKRLGYFVTKLYGNHILSRSKIRFE